jgi:hypothetical protein
MVNLPLAAGTTRVSATGLRSSKVAEQDSLILTLHPRFLMLAAQPSSRTMCWATYRGI